MHEAELAKAQILEDYSVKELHRAFTERTADVMFGEIGKAIAKTPWETPSQLIWLGYEYLVDSLYYDL